MRLYIAGEWIEKPEKIEVINPFDGSVVDTVPRGDLSDVDRVLDGAVRGAKIMAKVPGYERYRILKKAADLLEARAEDFARTITLEEGKIIAEGRAEVSRAVQTLTLTSAVVSSTSPQSEQLALIVAMFSAPPVPHRSSRQARREAS